MWATTERNCARQLSAILSPVKKSSVKFFINRKALNWRQALPIHAEWLYHVWGEILFSAVLCVLHALQDASDVLCACCFLSSCWYFILSSEVLKRTSIPYVWQVILIYALVLGGIIYPNHNGLLDDSGKFLPDLPTMLKLLFKAHIIRL